MKVVPRIARGKGRAEKKNDEGWWKRKRKKENTDRCRHLLRCVH